jgi:hypothetical protein
MIAIIPTIPTQLGEKAAYSGSPELISQNGYRILTENVSVNLMSDDRVRIASTTVYRNQGSATTATVKILDSVLQFASGPTVLAATWDNVPITLKPTTDASGKWYGIATVSLDAQATHSLSVNLFSKLTNSGYAKDEEGFRYRLTGSVPVDLFSMAYRYPSGIVFGLPTVQPDLGWEVGNRGASIRKTNFNPNNVDTSIEFYVNSMRPLGTKG